MAVTFRANKTQPLTYDEMDQNLGSFFYSSSIANGGRNLVLHYTGSGNVPINKTAHEVSLVSGVQPGVSGRFAFYSGSASLTTAQGLIISQSGGRVSVGINVNESTDFPLTNALEVSGSIRTSASVFQSSDARLKDNIETVVEGLSKIVSSRGVTYDKDGTRNAGVIAQEIQKTIPEVVSEDNKGYLSVNYSGIIGYLIEAVKELKTEVEELKTQTSPPKVD
tara:strand:+ start:9536 stop:10201 length:666 start_codon:yes stop_codon:yes gene_type:complete